ncbi:HipA domain-containing protein [Acinetobacter wanghuae]|uniref:HipA domain-containing protein n=1 Tax=Acinetobacter wanghuae TaxID=2662362 RepID=UPI003AF61FB9
MNEALEDYEIHDISHVEKDLLEPLGTKSKFWYSSNGDEFLFKSVESNNGIRFGEDWAEKIACELAHLLGLPHAHYELATYNNKRGVITKNFISERGEQLMLGNELLETFIVSEDGNNPNIQYVDDVYKIMTNTVINKPIGFSSLKEIKSASEFFVGYLMFDALISNQDRHNENWGTIITVKGIKHLAPSYDHGASLARNISDEVRHNRLTSNDRGQQVTQFVLKAKSWFLNRETRSRIKLLDAFNEYALMEQEAAKSWLKILKELDDEKVYHLISRVPEVLMSQVSKDFTFKLIQCNKSNLLALNF